MKSSGNAPALAIAVQLHQRGRLDEAANAYRQILAKQPGHADALHLLGVLTGQQGKPREAIELIERAIRIFPHASYYNNLANALKDSGRLDEAITAYRRATTLQRDYVGAHGNLGRLLMSKGRLEEAVASFREALHVSSQPNPLLTQWRNDLGVALARMNRLEEATAELRLVLSEQPDNADAHNNLGLILMQQGHLSEALAAFRRAVELNPKFAAAYSNLGIALGKQGASAEAIDSYRRSIELAPTNAMTSVNFAHALASAGEMAEAEAVARSAIEHAASFTGGYLVLGTVLRDIGQLDESLAAFDRAIELDPANTSAHSGRIFARHFHAGSDAAALAQDQRHWDERHGAPLRSQIPSHDNDPNPDRPLRIGYISPDFTSHVLALLMWPLLSTHDGSAFRRYLYSDVAAPQPLTERFRSCADVWRNIVGMPDDRVAKIIHEDRIDILVDLTMHMHGNRLLVFARKPAPVQVTWCYPGSTGLSAIDYRITDPYLDPPGLFDEFYSERSVRLLDTFFCYDPMTDEPAVGPLPAIRNGYITFGCLNNFCKVNEPVLDMWARVMSAVKDSRLMLLSPRGRNRQWVEDKLAVHGISPDRIEHLDRRQRPQYLELYNSIDISLDTVPYNGHTTSLDSFWMGVPVISMVGPTVVGRAGLSELTNLQLTELAAKDPDHFVTVTKTFCGSLQRLQLLRSNLRERMARSPLMDAKRFTRGMEDAYRGMWRLWCASRST